MDLLLGLVLLALVVLIVVVVVLAVRRSRPVPAPAPDAPRDPLAVEDEGVTDVRTLRAGDMVDYRGTLYFVRGSLRLNEGGFTWSEHFLDDSRGSRCWISVEEDPDLEVVLWETTELVTEPGGKTMEVAGTRYELDERGRANYTSEGTTAVGDRGVVQFADYEGPGDRKLSFERFNDGAWEAGLGEAVVLSALRVYPAGSSRT